MPILVNSDTSSRPSTQQMGDYLDSLGASYGERLMLTGAATSESGRDPGASHDNGIGFGMFGHNGSRLMQMRQFANQNGSDIGDWRTQTAFALNELRSRPEAKAAANATTPEQVALAQMYYERPQGFSEQNPEGGLNYAGRLNTIRSLASGDKNAPASFAASSGTAGTSGAGTMGAASGASGGSMAGIGGGAGSGQQSQPVNPSSIGNPQLNAALAKMLAQPTNDGFQPLVPYVIGKGTSALFGTLGSLLGGAPAPSAPPPSRPASPPVPSGGAPATSPSQPPGAAFSGAGTTNTTPPFFAAGPPPASPIVTPTLGPVSGTPTMAQSNGFNGLATLFGLGSAGA